MENIVPLAFIGFEPKDLELLVHLRRPLDRLLHQIRRVRKSGLE